VRTADRTITIFNCLQLTYASFVDKQIGEGKEKDIDNAKNPFIGNFLSFYNLIRKCQIGSS